MDSEAECEFYMHKNVGKMYVKLINSPKTNTQCTGYFPCEEVHTFNYFNGSTETCFC